MKPYKKKAFAQIIAILPGIAIALTILAVVFIIGSSVFSKAYVNSYASIDLNSSAGVVPVAVWTDLNESAIGGINALHDFGDNLPIVMAAIGGGLALLALMSGIGRASSTNL